ncbi:HERV-H LTR-associating protein 2 [Pezoporus flaviventris]|uniref:HERV-H LTR-associating protein 2 n=1 Tax=Pezoporus flaviventris TaxID=889875 RepID=UPI002AAF48CB|nr:HERV-H LTR-associating protein 2 [Pezoporus flaviventris]
MPGPTSNQRLASAAHAERRRGEGRGGEAAGSVASPQGRWGSGGGKMAPFLCLGLRGGRFHTACSQSHRNAVISVLASYNGTSHSCQPRVRINQSDFSLTLDDLTASSSGEYLCNASVPHYTTLTARALQVGKLPLLPVWRWAPARGPQSQSDISCFQSAASYGKGLKSSGCPQLPPTALRAEGTGRLSGSCLRCSADSKYGL